MQVMPFVPARRTFVLPRLLVSTTVAARAISGGAADNARAIFICVDSESGADARDDGFCAIAPEHKPTIPKTVSVMPRKSKSLAIAIDLSFAW
jgi:hypothetical protein